MPTFGDYGIQHPEPAEIDPRLMQITVRHCLQHTGGWDRSKSGDPMGSRSIRTVARSLGIQPPVKPEQIIRHMMGKSLDFDPGTAHAYSNFGYCILGRVIEKVSGKKYGRFVLNDVLEPLAREWLGAHVCRRAPHSACLRRSWRPRGAAKRRRTATLNFAVSRAA